MRIGPIAGLALVAMMGGPAAAVPAPIVFTPQAGFGGHSEGNGALRIARGKERSFHVESHGVEQSDGSFRLDQTVTFVGKQPAIRNWIIRTAGANHYAATLSDAAGPVTGSTEGNRLLLRYRVAGPLVMHQTLVLMPDATTIDNVGTITLFGVPVGRLHETILRKDDGSSIASPPTP